MKITEHTETRLTLQHQRPMMTWVLATFTIFSVGFLLNTLYQGLRQIQLLRAWRWIGWFTWLSFALVLVIFGAVAWANTGRGVTLIFDRNTETLRIRRPRLISVEEQIYSIYAISHLDIERNDEVRVFGIFLVLRSNERLALATAPLYDEAHIREITKTVRTFLRQT